MREYWIVDPYAKAVQAYRLEPSGRFGKMELVESVEPVPGRRMYPAPAVVRSHVLQGFEIGLESIFA